MQRGRRVDVEPKDVEGEDGELAFAHEAHRDFAIVIDVVELGRGREEMGGASILRSVCSIRVAGWDSTCIAPLLADWWGEPVVVVGEVLESLHVQQLSFDDFSCETG